MTTPMTRRKRAYTVIVTQTTRMTREVRVAGAYNKGHAGGLAVAISNHVDGGSEVYAESVGTWVKKGPRRVTVKNVKRVDDE